MNFLILKLIKMEKMTLIRKLKNQQKIKLYQIKVTLMYF